MARLREPKQGDPFRVRDLEIGFSLWPAKKTTRWKLQRRLYVRDPWAILFEAVYRAELGKSRIHEALSYLDQAEDYFNAGIERERLNVKPVLLYYSMLNLAKCLIAIRKPSLDMSQARHGLSADHGKDRAILGDVIAVKSSKKYINVFTEIMETLERKSPRNESLQVRNLLPQILPGHRLWTYACQKTEKFLAITEIKALVNSSDKTMWLRIDLNRGEAKHISKTTAQLIDNSHLPGQWQQVDGDQESITLEQVSSTKFTQRSVDHIQDLFQELRPALWCTVTSAYPHRKYYLFVDSALGKKVLPQWAAMYVLFFYLSDLTRYRPEHFDRFLESKYGPQIESVLDECPRQFLYLMASEPLQREVAPAAIV